MSPKMQARSLLITQFIQINTVSCDTRHVVRCDEPHALTQQSQKSTTTSSVTLCEREVFLFDFPCIHCSARISGRKTHSMLMCDCNANRIFFTHYISQAVRSFGPPSCDAHAQTKHFGEWQSNAALRQRLNSQPSVPR